MQPIQITIAVPLATAEALVAKMLPGYSLTTASGSLTLTVTNATLGIEAQVVVSIQG